MMLNFEVINNKTTVFLIICSVVLITTCTKRSDNQKVQHKTVSISLAGNAYLVQGAESQSITKQGIDHWKSASNVYKAYIKSDQSAKVEMFIRARTSASESSITLQAGSFSKTITLTNNSLEKISVGQLDLHKGYNALKFSGLSVEGKGDVKIKDVLLQTPKELALSYVKDNKSNHFYWGRRGPSVHLGYKLPNDKDAEWFYNELTVPQGMDPIGSYFMADGFGEGFFGMQVNSPDERHILFSVWSPYETDNPGEIPKSKRVELLKKGENVHAGKFGNEGSGGQSYWTYPWKAGKTYKFLMHVKPGSSNHTVYTAYFKAPNIASWKLIASFKRPKTNTWLKNPHSFLENFNASNGYKTRKAWYGNQWMRDKTGEWHQLTEATFTGDNIANIGFRKDYRGGTQSEKFYLQNGGFFNANTKLDSTLERKKTGSPPAINFSQLP